MSKEPRDTSKYARETFLVHGLPYDVNWDYGYHVIPPITASTTFRLDSTNRGADGFKSFGSLPERGEKPIYIYDRLAEPTVALLENAFREVEQGESATAFASGMAAISAALMVLTQQGTELIAHRTLYGCTYSLLTEWMPRMGVKVLFADLTDPAALDEFVTPSTRVVYFETPANPTLEVIDIPALSAAVAQTNESRQPGERIMVVVDNTFATPYCQRPLTLGADVVVHSLTKNVMGFGTDMGGMVVGPNLLHSRTRLARKDFGGVVSPRSAWSILVYGLSSLPVRAKRQVSNARRLAEYLEGRPEVARVHYPGLKSHPHHEIARRQMLNFKGEFSPGIMVYFELAGKGPALTETARKFMDYIAEHSYTLTLAVSLGQLKTLVEAPTLMTHAAYGDEAAEAGMSVGGIRLSAGIEDPDDLISDLEEAFDVIA